MLDNTKEYGKTKIDSLLSNINTVVGTKLTKNINQSSSFTFELNGSAFPVFVIGDTTYNSIILDVLINWGGVLKVKHFGSSSLNYSLSNNIVTASTSLGANTHVIVYA